MVPTGTFRTIFSPSRPVQLEPSPWRPRSPLNSGLKRKWTSVLCRSLDSMITSPPRPPSPPDGPPRGTNFSRRKAMHPLPPSPAFTRIIASSINMPIFDCTVRCRDSPLKHRPRFKNGAWTLIANSKSIGLRRHGSDSLIYLFFCYRLNLRSDIPVVSATIAHTGGPIAIELIGGCGQRACPGLESASVGSIRIRNVNLHGTWHRRPFLTAIGQLHNRIADSKSRMTHCAIRPGIKGDLLCVENFLHKRNQLSGV